MALRRLAGKYPRTTASVAVANLAPLAGVLFFGWSVGLVLVLYWLESGVVLLFTLLAGLVASEPSDTSNDQLILHGLVESDRRLELGSGGPAIWVRNVPVVLTMALIFGIFWVVHGAFVGVFVAVLGAGDLAVDWWLWLALLSVVLGQAEEVYSEQVVDRQYQTTSAKDQITGIFGRTIVLHVTLVLGGFLLFGALAVAPGGGAALLALFVALKAPYEFALRVRRREKKERRDQSAVDG